MLVKPHYDLIEEKFRQQKKPSAIGTLKRVDCEINNLLENNELSAEWHDIFTDLRKQVLMAI